jgi:UDP-N-acetylglucosamine/UDP-N-acetylgalactosamine diphosphorylase
VVETARTEEFAPIKNAAGEDSAASSHRLQSDRAAAWLAAAGVEVPRRPDGHVDANLEISPLTALEAGDLAGVKLPERICRGDSIFL